MKLGVAYADKFKQVWLKLEVPDGSTVLDAIRHSGILEQFPEIDLDRQKVGIFGKLTKRSARVVDGERVGIHREIAAGPERVDRHDT